MTILEKQRTTMYWQSFGKKPQQLKELSIPHLNNILGILEKYKGKTINTYPPETWKKVIKKEIAYRNRMGNKIIQLFPSIKQAVKNQLKLAI